METVQVCKCLEIVGTPCRSIGDACLTGFDLRTRCGLRDATGPLPLMTIVPCETSLHPSHLTHPRYRQTWISHRGFTQTPIFIKTALG